MAKKKKKKKKKSSAYPQAAPKARKTTKSLSWGDLKSQRTPETEEFSWREGEWTKYNRAFPFVDRCPKSVYEKRDTDALIECPFCGKIDSRWEGAEFELHFPTIQTGEAYWVMDKYNVVPVQRIDGPPTRTCRVKGKTWSCGSCHSKFEFGKSSIDSRLVTPKGWKAANSAEPRNRFGNWMGDTSARKGPWTDKMHLIDARDIGKPPKRR